MDNLADKDTLIETLLQERDELYQELSKLRQIDGGALEHYEAIIREKDNKIRRLDEKVKKFEDKIKQLTDQLAWLRRKFWKASSEKYIPADPAQRKIDFDGLDVLPEEEETIKAAASEIDHV